MVRPLSKAERHAMMTNHVGMVTAVLHNDAEAIESQSLDGIQDLAEMAESDVTLMLALLGKRLEADARVTAVVLKTLAHRLGQPSEEIHRMFAQVMSELDEDEIDSAFEG